MGQTEMKICDRRWEYVYTICNSIEMDHPKLDLRLFNTPPDLRYLTIVLSYIDEI